MPPRTDAAPVAPALVPPPVLAPLPDAPARPQDSPSDGPSGGRRTHYRWVVCALLFLATTINYVDRSVLGILAPTLAAELRWSEVDYGAIVSWFTLAYGLGFLVAGRVMDRVGVRRGLAGYLVAWSVAAMAHALARSPVGFSVARFALGLGESGNFPGAVKAVAEWFPQRERSLATGVFNAGSNVGAIVTPLLVPWLALTFGWRAAFVVTGALGFGWLVAWLALYRRPDELAAASGRGRWPRVSAAELAHVRDGEPAATAGGAPPASPPWTTLVAHRQLWAFAAGKFLTDGVWWFYLFWLPKFLDAEFGVRLAGLAGPLVVVYLMADVGSVAGGWFGTALLGRGWTPNRARKTALLVPALLVLPTALTPLAGRSAGLWGAVALVALAAAAHQGWSCNLYTLASDLFPRAAVGSVVGIGSAAGALGGWLFQRATGHVLAASGGGYAPIFVVCGLAYVTALLVVHALAPRLAPARLRGSPPSAPPAA